MMTIKARKCVNCGFCCRVAPCPYGEVTSDTNPACRFLVPSKPGRWLCGKYKEIIGRRGADVTPAFGGGCSSSLGNTYRRRILENEEHADRLILEDHREEKKPRTRKEK